MLGQDDSNLSMNNADGEYEEISSEEVDRVVGVLEELMASVQSENIKALLEDASTEIYFLVYDDEDDSIESEAA